MSDQREYPLPIEGHALPQADWDQVCADAAHIREAQGEPEPLDEGTLQDLLACQLTDEEKATLAGTDGEEA